MDSEKLVLFEDYVVTVRGLSPVTARKYAGAVEKCSEILLAAGYRNGNLFQAKSIVELGALKNTLFALPQFQELNTTGHNMYSRGVKTFISYREASGF